MNTGNEGCFDGELSIPSATDGGELTASIEENQTTNLQTINKKIHCYMHTKKK